MQEEYLLTMALTWMISFKLIIHQTFMSWGNDSPTLLFSHFNQKLKIYNSESFCWVIMHIFILPAKVPSRFKDFFFLSFIFSLFFLIFLFWVTFNPKNNQDKVLDFNLEKNV